MAPCLFRTITTPIASVPLTMGAVRRHFVVNPVILSTKSLKCEFCKIHQSQIKLYSARLHFQHLIKIDESID